MLNPLFLVVLFYYVLIYPVSLGAEGSGLNRNEPFTTLEIRYHIAGAGEVILVWGVNGWKIVPETMRPAKTVVEDVMYTHMEQKGNVFVAKVVVPSGTTVDYAFEITKKINGESIDIWDTNGPRPPRDYHTTVLKDSIAKVNANLTMEQYIKLGRGIYICLYFLLMVFAVFSTSIILRHTLLSSGWGNTWSKNLKRGIGISLDFSSKNVVIFIISIGLLNLLVVGTTSLYYHFLRIPDFWKGHSVMMSLSRHLNLALEGTVANWYSSMLIFLIPITAVLCFIVDKKRFESRRERLFTNGWLLMAMFFLVLSFDEIASFHERLGMMDINPFSNWRVGWISQLAIPIGLVTFFLLGFAWLHLHRSRLTLVLMVLGTLLYLAVPVEEWIELTLWSRASHHESWQTLYRPILQVAAEEGTELFAALSFLSANLVYLHYVAKQSIDKNNTSTIIDFIEKPNTLLVDTVLLLCIYGLGMKAVELTVKYIPFYYASVPANWFPSTLAVMAAIICLQIWSGIRSKNGLVAYLYMIFALFSILLSMYYGANMRGGVNILHGSGLSIKQITGIGLLTSAVILSAILLLQVKEWWSRIGTFAWVILLGLSFLGSGRTKEAGILDFAAFAFLLVSLLAHIYRWGALEENRHSLSRPLNQLGED